MAKALIHGLTAVVMKVGTNKIKSMELAFFRGRMVVPLKGNTLKVRKMVKESIYGLMAIVMKVNL
jgi:hypothetical protein